jgi:hypothetical protein
MSVMQTLLLHKVMQGTDAGASLEFLHLVLLPWPCIIPAYTIIPVNIHIPVRPDPEANLGWLTHHLVALVSILHLLQGLYDI